MIKLIIYLTGVTCFVEPLVSGTDWGYETENGPPVWNSSYPNCGLSKQSPVNIKIAETKYAPELSKIIFKNYENILTSNFSITNNGHTVQLNLFSSEAAISGGNLPGSYRLQQLHFHWGRDNNEGSEHQIDSASYPVEIHLVHFNQKYTDLTTAIDKPEGLAVLGVLVQAGTGQSIPVVTQSTLNNVMYKGSTYWISNFALSNFLPVDTTKYYRYSGSLTTPPCFESVIWTVFEQPITVPVSQIELFRNQLKRTDTTVQPSHSIDHNFRPVQPLNDREVCKSFQESAAATEWRSGFTYLITFVLLAQLACNKLF